MVKVYADLIEQGLRELTQVPALWREGVRQELIERGFLEK
ncbi:CD1375 family protein [Geosporobacter ferrireducens]|nr:CD1375 family protein [Geosporobacter ferrireducens]